MSSVRRRLREILPFLPLSALIGNEYSLTFFSEARLTLLKNQLGHDRVSRIRDKVTSIITERMKTGEREPPKSSNNDFNRGHVLGTDNVFISACIKCDSPYDLDLPEFDWGLLTFGSILRSRAPILSIPRQAPSRIRRPQPPAPSATRRR